MHVDKNYSVTIVSLISTMYSNSVTNATIDVD